ncbi:dihydrolipoamide acetyltransferase family protein [Synechococcus lacustris]|uniref:dihydrolipoamide acetyltransferase family protein n=1 Tax=Synechococcus lacustris TaxID=2116544 RepID=UPI0020CBE6DD|nr:dihydrolipoamide acetyltransferase family protein [Synechococcus lacustris]MCP9794526.1 2-oxo acid dehydrogenase subunit E2 [Synechococcus lacustris L1F-Slac]
MATFEIFMPALSSTMTEGKIVEWLKQPGDRVERGESVLVVESDKADMDVESFEAGFLGAVLLPAGSTAPVGETIGLVVETEAELENLRANGTATPSPTATPTATAPPAAVPPPTPAPEVNVEPKAEVAAVGANRVIASPRARKLAQQLGVKLEGLKGSGPHGRLVAADVEKAAGQVPSIAPASAAPAAAVVPLPAVVVAAPGETKPFSTLQQAVNRNMMASLATPSFRVGYTITTTKLDAFYKQVKPKGVTMTALLAKAVALTLVRHPQLNAAYSDAGTSFPTAINVAVAVAMEGGGLLTPVLAQADRVDLYSLSRNWADLVARARTKQLKPEEYSSGTFTLSNLGMFGVDRFDAILPPGTGAILAVGASRPVVVANSDGSIAVKAQMQVNITADHRVIYGADAAAFLKDLALLIENDPESLAL